MTAQLPALPSKERISELKENFLQWRNDYDQIEDAPQYRMFSDAMIAMDMLLAGLEQEPVGYYRLAKDGVSYYLSHPTEKLDDYVVPLFTHPAPSIPEAPVAVDEIAEQAGIDPDIADAYMQGYYDSDKILSDICDLFKIGEDARTRSAIMTNIENAIDFAEKLNAIELEFFMVPGEPDDDYPDEEPADECLVNCWGTTTEQYVEQFRAALKSLSAPVVSEQQVSVVKPVMFIDGDISSEDADKMARILQDFNAEEPIDNGEYGSAYQGAREDLAIWKHRALEAEEKLRTAPVAVPDEVVKSLDSLLNKNYFRLWVKEPLGYVGGSIAVRDLVNVVLFANACRAAMLQHSTLTNEGGKQAQSRIDEAVELLKRAIPQMLENKDTDGALVGPIKSNSQAIPDGWVKCSDRMPEIMKTVIVAEGEYISYMWWNGEAWDCWDDHGELQDVTHWMPLPAAPKPEGE